MPQTTLLISLAAGLAFRTTAGAQSVVDFYNGKTISVNIGFSAGGGAEGVTISPV